MRSLYQSAATFALLMFIGSSGSLYAATSVTQNGFFVNVDLEDFFAGRLINDQNGGANQIFENLGKPGSGILTTTDIGFSINATRNSYNNGVANGGGSTQSAALYDTDRRLYYDATSGGSQTRVFSQIQRRDDASAGQAGKGEDPDLEYDETSGNNWAGGNITTRQGNMVIVQENVTGAEASQGHLNLAQGADGGSANNSPDDMTQGELKFTFQADLTRYDFTWIDLERENEVWVTFSGIKDTNGGSLADVRIRFDDFDVGGTYDQGTNWGDNHANTVIIGVDSSFTPSGNNSHTAFAANTASFNTVIFDTGTNSGGVGNFAYRLKDPVVVYPEASTVVAMLTLLLSGLFFYCWKRFRAGSQTTPALAVK
jgi:hypothetical protein